MPADKELLRWRFENLKKLDLLCEIYLTEEGLLEEIEEATDNSQVEYLDDRYLIVLKSMYQEQDDERHCETCDTLDNAEEVVLDWVFQEAGTDYTFFAYVYNLDDGVPVYYDIEKRVRWGGA